MSKVELLPMGYKIEDGDLYDSEGNLVRKDTTAEQFFHRVARSGKSLSLMRQWIELQEGV